MPKGETIPHEEHLRNFINLETQKTRAAKTNVTVASPTADVNSLKAKLDEVIGALKTAGVLK